MEKYFAATFSMLGPRVNVTEVREFVKLCKFDRWGKVRVGNRGDLMRAAVTLNGGLVFRDNSYVRVSALLIYHFTMQPQHHSFP